MKKTTIFALSLLAVVAIMAYPATTYGGAKSISKTDATAVSSKSACASDDKAQESTATKATKTASKGKTCSLDNPAGCVNEVKSASATETVMDGQYVVKAMSVKGMTCVGCENSVSAALMTVPGVVEVVSVDHKKGEAIVKVDPAKEKEVDALLTKAVTDKGYEAEIIPAVATTTDAAAAKVCPTSGAKMPACMKSCTTEKKAETTEKTLDDTK